MSNINRRNYLFISIAYLLVTLSYLLSEYIITGHRFGVPLDDTWIHFRFAENFSYGHLFEYNINEPTPGTTSSLWVILLSISFFPKINPLFFSLVLSSLFFLLTCFETYRLSLKLGFTPNLALMAALLVVFAGRLAWSSLSGMEITLFCYLTLLAVETQIPPLNGARGVSVPPLRGARGVFVGLLLGLASATRPEGILLAVIYYGIAMLPPLRGARGVFVSFAVFLLITLPYPIFSCIHTGSFLPNTFKGQGGEFRFLPDMVFLRETGKLFFKDNLIILILWFAAMGAFIVRLLKRTFERNFLLINLWVILLPLVSSVLTPNWRHHGRYLIPLIPFIIIVSLNTAYMAYVWLKKHLVGQTFLSVARRIFFVTVYLLSLISSVIYGRALGWNVENINNQQVKVAQWLNQNFPNEKAFGMNDIGAIGFITKKKIVDMAGLVNPEVFEFEKMPEPEANKNLLKLLKDNGVNYIIIYPHWYQYLTTHYADALEKIYSARLAYNTICGGDEAVVYKIKWDLISL